MRVLKRVWTSPYATSAIGAPSPAPGSGRLRLGQAAIDLVEPIAEVLAGHDGRIQAPSPQPAAPHVDNRVFTASRKRVAVVGTTTRDRSERYSVVLNKRHEPTQLPGRTLELPVRNHDRGYVDAARLQYVVDRFRNRCFGVLGNRFSQDNDNVDVRRRVIVASCLGAKQRHSPEGCAKALPQAIGEQLQCVRFSACSSDIELSAWLSVSNCDISAACEHTSARDRERYANRHPARHPPPATTVSASGRRRSISSSRKPKPGPAAASGHSVHRSSRPPAPR